MTSGYMADCRRLEYAERARARRKKRLVESQKLGTHTKQEWQEIKDFFGACVACGTTEERLEKDHIIPISRGGCESPYNLQPLCLSCNNHKGTNGIDYRVTFCEDHGKIMPKKWHHPLWID